MYIFRGTVYNSLFWILSEIGTSLDNLSKLSNKKEHRSDNLEAADWLFTLTCSAHCDSWLAVYPHLLCTLWLLIGCLLTCSTHCGCWLAIHSLTCSAHCGCWLAEVPLSTDMSSASQAVSWNQTDSTPLGRGRRCVGHRSCRRASVGRGFLLSCRGLWATYTTLLLIDKAIHQVRPTELFLLGSKTDFEILLDSLS